MTYRRPLLSFQDMEIGDAVFYYAWSCGLDSRRSFDLGGVAEFVTAFGHANSVTVHGVVHKHLTMRTWKRKRSQVRRYVIRNRRAYNHNQALVRRHEQEMLRPPFWGMRCGGCKHIPPQPGEVMEEE